MIVVSRQPELQFDMLFITRSTSANELNKIYKTVYTELLCIQGFAVLTTKIIEACCVYNIWLFY